MLRTAAGAVPEGGPVLSLVCGIWDEIDYEEEDPVTVLATLSFSPFSSLPLGVETANQRHDHQSVKHISEKGS